jgi:catechol 2,3-dioxygenase-like lactoylglutathione lyase family enzyme
MPFMSTHSFQIRGLDHVQLAMPAGQEAAARDFYAGILGLTEIPKPANLAKRGGVWFAGGALRLHLGAEADFHPAKKAHPALLVQNLDALASHLQQVGVTVTTDEPLEGYQRIYVSDPPEIGSNCWSPVAHERFAAGTGRMTRPP